jgi:hypothetical protein
MIKLAVATAATLGVTFAVSAGAQTVKTVSIIAMNDTPQLLEVKEGLVKGLFDHG